MRRAIVVGFALFSAVSCFAQVHSVVRSGSSTGYHSGGYHSGGYSGRPYRRGYVYAYPVYVGGYGGYYGDYSSGYAPGYAPDPGYQSGYQPGYQQAPPAAPPVVINQYFGGPPMAADQQAYPQQQQQPQDEGSIRLYQQQQSQQAPEPAPSDTRTYLIAYKDHSVYTALAYWIEGQTLHYITAGNTHNQTDLSLIDIDFTKKLNADRSMPFNVPTSQ